MQIIFGKINRDQSFVCQTAIYCNRVTYISGEIALQHKLHNTLILIFPCLQHNYTRNLKQLQPNGRKYPL